MKRGLYYLNIILVTGFLLILSSGFISASLFDNFFGKITGKATDTKEYTFTLNAFNAPFSYAGGSCVKNPIKVIENLKEGNVIKLISSQGSLCARYYPRTLGNCKDTISTCLDNGKTGSVIPCNNENIKLAFYDNTKNPPLLIGTYIAYEFINNGNGIPVPKGANSLYAYFDDLGSKNNYFDNNGYQNCTFKYSLTSCTPECSGKVCGDNTCGGSCGSCSTGQSCTSAGQCVNVVEPCTDSDNGLNYYIKGITKGPGADGIVYESSDQCSNDNKVLIENQCLNGKINAINYPCLFGCYSGACIRQKISSLEKTPNSISPGVEMIIKVNTAEDDKTYPTNEEGWNIQYYTYQYVNGKKVQVSGTGLNGNAALELNGVGSSKFNAPGLGNYVTQFHLYCGKEGSVCWNITGGHSYQWIEEINFSVLNNNNINGSCLELMNKIDVSIGSSCNNSNYNPIADVNKDRFVTPSDKLIVINVINANNNSENFCSEKLKATTCPTGCTSVNCVVEKKEVDRCLQLSYSHMNNIYTYKKIAADQGLKIALKEGQPIGIDDFFITFTSSDQNIQIWAVYKIDMNSKTVTLKEVINPNSQVIQLNGNTVGSTGTLVLSDGSSATVTLTTNSINDQLISVTFGSVSEIDLFNCSLVNSNTCTENDGGDNRYLMGKTCLGKECKTDNCSKKEIKYSSCEGEDCYYEYLQEYYCYKDENNNYDSYPSELIYDKTYQCSAGCSNGACNIINVNNEVCSDWANLVANPKDIDIYGIKYETSDWSDSYREKLWINDKEYNASTYYSSWQAYEDYENDKYSYNNAWINARVMVADDKNLDLSKLAEERLNYGLCKVESYWDSEDKKNIVYVCNWDALNNKQSLEEYQYKSRQIIWTKDNVWNEIEVNFGKSLSEEEINKLALESVNDFLNDIKDNQAKYIGWDKFNIPYIADNFLRFALMNCSSDLQAPINDDNETCNPSWECKIEPTICPEYGYQKRVCRDYSCNQNREEQIYCSPGICSGCYVPRWFRDTDGMNNICIPYGMRFEQQTDTGEQKLVEYTNEDRINENLNGDYILEIKSENEATLVLFGKDNKNYTYLLTPDTKITIDIPGWDDDIEEFIIYVKKIVIDGDDRYVDLTVYSSRYENVIDSINAYCDFDGVVKKQKVADSNNDWAKCQNHFECESNACWSGECTEVGKLLDEASSYKQLGVKVLCRLANLFSIESYNSCVSKRLGKKAIVEPRPSSGGNKK
ncbi:MAG: hypothetical protein WC867_02360 [Candidatus Pacearchaeota archaeon]|jgi:hypothetical protein